MSYTVASTTTCFVGLGFSIAAQPSVELGHGDTAKSVLLCDKMAPTATPCVGLGFLFGAQSSIELEQGPAANDSARLGFISGAQSTALPRHREEPLDDEATPTPASYSRMQGTAFPRPYWDTDIVDPLLDDPWTVSSEVIDEDQTPKPPSHPRMPSAPRIS